MATASRPFINALPVTDTRMAACLLALGFPGGVHVTIHTRTREAQVEVRFEAESTRFPTLSARQITSDWKTGRLEAEEPMHLFCCMMRAQQSYDALLKLQREGGSIRLDPNDEEKPLFYHSTVVPAWLDGEQTEGPLEDLSLVAAQGPLGIGLVQLLGSPGQRRYLVAALGRPVMLSDGTFHRHRAADLVRRAPDGKVYALEVEQPMHPLVMGLEALHARGLLKEEIKRAQGNASLLVPANDGGARQALIALNPAERVVRIVERHLGAPPGSLDL